MIPEEFVEFSAGFEVGFLAWISDGKPTMERTDFLISQEKIVVEPKEYDPLRLPAEGTKVALIFANPWYAERCEMGIVKGILIKEGNRLEIDAYDITWTFSFNIDRYPEKLVKRWKKR